MKCKNCGAELREESSFCYRCGHDLRGINLERLAANQQLTTKFEVPKKIKKPHNLMKKLSEMIHLCKIQLSKKTKEFSELVKKFSKNIHSKNIELLNKVKELLHKLMKKIKESIHTKKLVIIDGWTWGTEGDYTYVRGSVENTGNMSIDHFEVDVKYQDINKTVIDSDFISWNRRLQPGECKEFEIKHHINKKYQDIDISVNNYKKSLWG